MPEYDKRALQFHELAAPKAASGISMRIASLNGGRNY
jgi:hypothetical protein